MTMDAIIMMVITIVDMLVDLFTFFQECLKKKE